MTEWMGPRTKSAAQRIGDVPCPDCNRKGDPVDKIPTSISCAWCWNGTIHTRYVKLTVFLKWQEDHPGAIDDEDIPTSPESRGALTPIPPTDPDPNARDT